MQACTISPGSWAGSIPRSRDATTDVLLEIAYFNPESIGVTGRRLGLASDARTRFERGVDPAWLDGGLDGLTSLILRLCGGSPSEVVRAGAPPAAPKVIGFDPALTARLGGVEVARGGTAANSGSAGFRGLRRTGR